MQFCFPFHLFTMIILAPNGHAALHIYMPGMEEYSRWEKLAADRTNTKGSKEREAQQHIHMTNTKIQKTRS